MKQAAAAEVEASKAVGAAEAMATLQAECQGLKETMRAERHAFERRLAAAAAEAARRRRRSAHRSSRRSAASWRRRRTR